LKLSLPRFDFKFAFPSYFPWLFSQCFYHASDMFDSDYVPFHEFRAAFLELYPPDRRRQLASNPYQLSSSETGADTGLGPNGIGGSRHSRNASVAAASFFGGGGALHSNSISATTATMLPLPNSGGVSSRSPSIAASSAAGAGASSAPHPFAASSMSGRTGSLAPHTMGASGSSFSSSGSGSVSASSAGGLPMQMGGAHMSRADRAAAAAAAATSGQARVPREALKATNDIGMPQSSCLFRHHKQQTFSDRAAAIVSPCVKKNVIIQSQRLFFSAY
jgi:hypothetical protein